MHGEMPKNLIAYIEWRIMNSTLTRIRNIYLQKNILIVQSYTPTCDFMPFSSNNCLPVVDFNTKCTKSL